MPTDVQFRPNKQALRRATTGPMVKHAVDKAAKQLERYARQEISRSVGVDSEGAMEESIESTSARTKGERTTAKVGTSGIKYARWVHGGTTQFAPIFPKRAKLLRWDSKLLGHWISKPFVQGQQANPFLERAYKRLRPNDFR